MRCVSHKFASYDGGYENVLVAYLARNPLLGAICDHVIVGARSNSSRESARVCAEYVRSHPLSWNDCT